MSSVELNREEMLQLLGSFRSDTTLLRCMAELNLQPESTPFCDAVDECLSDGLDHHLSCLEYARRHKLPSFPWLESWEARCVFLRRYLERLLPAFGRGGALWSRIENPYFLGPELCCQIKWHVGRVRLVGSSSSESLTRGVHPISPGLAAAAEAYTPHIKEVTVRGAHVGELRLLSSHGPLLQQVQALWIEGPHADFTGQDADMGNGDQATALSMPVLLGATQLAKSLQHLQQLGLAANNLKTFPLQLLTDLPALRKLDLSNNLLSTFPPMQLQDSNSPRGGEPARRTCLIKILILAGNRLTRMLSSSSDAPVGVPDEFSSNSNGEFSSQSDGNGEDIDPSGKASGIDFSRLEVLDLSGNQLRKLRVTASLVGLRTLNVSANRLVHIDGPSVIAAAQRTRLESRVEKAPVSSAACTVPSTEDDIGTSPVVNSLQQLVIKGNRQLMFPPTNISEGTGSDVVNFFIQLSLGSEPWAAERLLIVGRQHAGKTSLCNALFRRKVCSGEIGSSTGQETVGVNTRGYSISYYDSYILRSFRGLRLRLPAAVHFAVGTPFAPFEPTFLSLLPVAPAKSSNDENDGRSSPHLPTQPAESKQQFLLRYHRIRRRTVKDLSVTRVREKTRLPKVDSKARTLRLHVRRRLRPGLSASAACRLQVGGSFTELDWLRSANGSPTEYRSDARGEPCRCWIKPQCNTSETSQLSGGNAIQKNHDTAPCPTQSIEDADWPDFVTNCQLIADGSGTLAAGEEETEQPSLYTLLDWAARSVSDLAAPLSKEAQRQPAPRPASDGLRCADSAVLAASSCWYSGQWVANYDARLLLCLDEFLVLQIVPPRGRHGRGDTGGMHSGISVVVSAVHAHHTRPRVALIESQTRRPSLFSSATISVAKALLEAAKNNTFHKCQKLLTPAEAATAKKASSLPLARKPSQTRSDINAADPEATGARDPYLLDCKPGRRSYYFVHHVAFWGSDAMLDWLDSPRYRFASDIWWAHLDAAGQLPHEVATARNHDVQFIERLVALERRSLASSLVCAETHNAQHQPLEHAPLLLDLGSNRDRDDFVHAVSEHQNCLRRHTAPHDDALSAMQHQQHFLPVRDSTMGVRVSDFAGQTQYYTLHSLAVTPQSCVFLVFDILSAEEASTRNMLLWWLQLLYRRTEGRTCVWLVASKIDALDRAKRARITRQLVGYLRQQLKRTMAVNSGTSSQNDTETAAFEQMTNGFRVHYVSSWTFEGVHRLAHALLSVVVNTERSPANVLGADAAVFPNLEESRTSTQVRPRATLVTQRFPKSYVILERTMSSMKQDKVLLPLEKFCKRAIAHGLATWSEHESCLRFLCSIGCVMWFPQLLQDFVILRPEWMTTLVACVIQESHPGKERITLEDMRHFLRRRRKRIKEQLGVDSAQLPEDSTFEEKKARSQLRMLRQGIFEEGMFTILWQGVENVDIRWTEPRASVAKFAEPVVCSSASVTSHLQHKEPATGPMRSAVPWRLLVDLLCKFQVCVRLPRSVERWFTSLFTPKLGHFAPTFSEILQAYFPPRQRFFSPQRVLFPAMLSDPHQQDNGGRAQEVHMYQDWYGLPRGAEHTIGVRYRARGATLSRPTLVANILGAVLAPMLACATAQSEQEDALRLCSEGFTLKFAAEGRPEVMLRIYSSGDAWSIASGGIAQATIAPNSAAPPSSTGDRSEVGVDDDCSYDGAHIIIDLGVKARDSAWLVPEHSVDQAPCCYKSSVSRHCLPRHSSSQADPLLTRTDSLLQHLELLINTVDNVLDGVDFGKVMLSPPCVAQCGLAWGLPVTAATTASRLAAASPYAGAIGQLLRAEGFDFEILSQVSNQQCGAKHKHLGVGTQRHLQAAHRPAPHGELVRSAPKTSTNINHATALLCCVCPCLGIAISWREVPVLSQTLQLLDGGLLQYASQVSLESTPTTGAKATIVEWPVRNAWSWPTLSARQLSESALGALKDVFVPSELKPQMHTSAESAAAAEGNAAAHAIAATVASSPLLTSPLVKEEEAGCYVDTLCSDAEMIFASHIRACVHNIVGQQRDYEEQSDHEFAFSSFESLECCRWLSRQPGLMLTTMRRHAPDILEEVCSGMPEIKARNPPNATSDPADVNAFGLTDNEVFAIAAYTQDMQQYSLYRALKKSLAKCGDSSARLVHLQLWSGYIVHLLRGLQKLPSANGTIVFRGICNQPGWEKRYLDKGNIFCRRAASHSTVVTSELGGSGRSKEDGAMNTPRTAIQWITFASTSLKEREARRFMNPHSGLLLRLTVHSAKDIRSFSLMEEEEELLLLPGSTFVVTHARNLDAERAPNKQDNFAQVHLEECDYRTSLRFLRSVS